jgi:hypothetical protein
MLTLFAVPKPFQGHVGLIQRNAIQSWLSLRPACEIVLLGDDPGTSEAAAEFKVRHVPLVARNEYGTPLVDSIFYEGVKAAEHSLICYVNADIILKNDFLSAVRRGFETKPECLIVGQRWDIDIKETIDFSHPWEEKLESFIRNGQLHAHTGIDYFVFPRGLYKKIPPFAIGRTAWDNWLIYDVRSRGIPVVDITEVATVIHQNHGYFHHPQEETDIWKGPEARRNLELARGYANIYTIKNANFKLTRTGIRRRLPIYHYYRLLVTRFLHPIFSN